VADPVITLTTDFGPGSPYVAAMKGVILGINPRARILDLGHSVPPQDLRHAAYFLQNAIPFFPPGMIHVVVVDPGVGTERAILYVCVAGHQLLVPDNGCWTGLADDLTNGLTVIRLTEPAYWRSPVSWTFHGRDILASAAAHLSLGLDPGKLGVRAGEWARLETPGPQWQARGVAGAVIFVDDFGNLITNLPADASEKLPPGARVVRVGESNVRPAWVNTYGQAAAGDLVALTSSSGTLEIAVVQGSAARRLGARIGSEVMVTVE
jgi:S-adenosylmethionine hydrolase